MGDSYYLERGRKRLANWAEWSTRDSPALDYPKASPYARLARAGDGWDSPDEHYAVVQSAIPVDDLDAERVEALVMLLPCQQRGIVCVIYLREAAPSSLAARLQITRLDLDARLEAIEESIGRGLTAPSNGGNAMGGGLYARK